MHALFDSLSIFCHILHATCSCFIFNCPPCDVWSCCLCTCYVLSCYQVEISEYLIAQAEEEMERTGEKKAVRKLKKAQPKLHKFCSL